MKNIRSILYCLIISLVLLTGCSAAGASRTVDGNDTQEMVQLMVLYPQPTDVEKFENDYRDHLELLHEKANILENTPLPYTITKFLPTPEGPAPYYQLFTMYFPSVAALQQAQSNFEEVAADAVRISSGGAPVVLVGNLTP